MLLAALSLAPAAQAAQRFAAPGGTGVDCAQAAPCSLAEAISKAKAGDEVIVGSGTYTVIEPLFPEAGGSVDVHGDYGGPMPTVKAAFPGPVVGGAVGGRVGYLAVDNLSPGAGGIQCVKGLVERVSVKVSGKRSVGVGAVAECIVRDSLLLADGAESIAFAGVGFEPGLTGFVRNVTAVATGPESIGLQSEYGVAPPGDFTLDIRNTIAEGARADLHTLEGFNGPGDIVVAASNYDRPVQDFGTKITDAGGNQAPLPLFLNAAAGDFRQAAGSPTIDGGVLDPRTGGSDLLGSPRVVGAAPDIGAYELVPAAPPGQIQSLDVRPRTFRPTGAKASATKRARAPKATTVTYSLSGAATVSFVVERKVPGRRVGRRCVRQTKANRGKKKCPLFRPVKGGFTHGGAVGANSFRFSGRLGARALAPGAYVLVGSTEQSSRRAPFRIVTG